MAASEVKSKCMPTADREVFIEAAICYAIQEAQLGVRFVRFSECRTQDINLRLFKRMCTGRLVFDFRKYTIRTITFVSLLQFKVIGTIF